MPNLEARESDSPVRLPYETPTMGILLDSSVPYPRDPNFGAFSNVGRFEPIPSVVDPYVEHPKGLFDRTTARLGEIASRFAKPALVLETAVGGATGAAVITLVQPEVPSAEASGGMLVTASAEGTSCVEDKNLLQIDFDYARKIISGEVVIATKDNILAAAAAAAKGDTAVRQPITPEEAWQNLIIPAPECPEIKTPEPTPADLISSTQYLEQVLLTQNSSDIVDRTDTQISTKIDNFWSKYGDYINSYPDPTSIKEGAVLSKKTLIEYLGYLVSGQDNDQQSAAASGEIALLLAIDEKVSRDTNIPRDVQIKIRKNLRSIGDMLYDYARLNVKGGIKDFLESDIKDLFTFYIGKYGIILS